MKRTASIGLLIAFTAAAGCTGTPTDSTTPVPSTTTMATSTTSTHDVCSTMDATVGDAAYVIATEPGPGEAVVSPLTVRGCSRSYESTVTWTLTDAKGVTLGSGFAMGGGFEGGGPFEFKVAFDVSAAQVLHLEVSDSGGSDEGGPAPRTVLPLVAMP